MVSYQIQGCSSIICSIKLNDLIRNRYFSYGRIASLYYWKVISAALIIVCLFMLGFKSVKYDEDIVKLCVKNTSRLSNERQYYLEATTEYEQLRHGSIVSVIQESNMKESLLTREFLLDHFELLQKIFDMQISYKQQMYSIKDLCIQLQLPRLYYFNQEQKNLIQSMLPCQIISPITCFWESSKLATGFDSFFNRLIWSKQDPYKLIKEIFLHNATAKFIRDIFMDAQMERGYLDKPCLNPADTDCPNKNRKYSVKAVLSKSCVQFSKLLYNYPRNLLVSHVNGQALQTILLLRSPSDLHTKFMYNSPHWSDKDTGEILQRWNLKLRQTIESYNKHRKYLPGVRNSFRLQRVAKSSFSVLHDDYIKKALQETSSNNNAITKYLAGIGAVIIFVGLTFLVSDNLIQSHCWLAIIGVLVVVMTIFGGLGLSAAVDIRFSILSSQVLPFFILGISAEELLILTPIYFSHLKKAPDKKTGSPLLLPDILYESATALLTSFIIKILTISFSFIIQLPLVFSFLAQLLIVLIFKTLFLLLVYPCFLHLDLIRQSNNRVDLICCLVRRNKLPPTAPEHYTSIPLAPIILTTEYTTSHITHETVVKQYCEINPPVTSHHPPPPVSPSYRPPKIKIRNTHTINKSGPTITWKIRYKISRTIVQIIGLIPVQITIVIIILIIILFGIYSVINIDFGIINESLFFRGTNEQKYVAADSKYFRLNNFQIFVSDIDYLYNMNLLIQMHHDLLKIGHQDNMQIIMSGNGIYWLQSFKRWLKKLQRDFQSDIDHNFILTNGKWFRNASHNGLLAMTLFVQDNYDIDYSQMMRRSQIFDREDRPNIPPGHLPLYLAAWRSDAIDFPTVPCVIDALPPPIKFHEYMPNKMNLDPKPIRLHATPSMSQSIQFTTCNYYLIMRIDDKEKNKDKNTFPYTTVKSIRGLIDRSSQLGLASMPIGQLFELSEQFTDLRRDFSLALLGCSLATTGIVIIITSGNCVAGLLSGIIWFCGVMFTVACIYLTWLLPFNPILGVSIVLINGMCLVNSPILLIVNLSTNKSPHNSIYTRYKSTYIDRSKAPDSNNEEEGRSADVIPNPESCKFISVEDQLTFALTEYGRRDVYIAITSLISFFILSVNQITFFKYHFFLVPLISMSIVPFFYFFVVPTTMLYVLQPLPIPATISPENTPLEPPASDDSSNQPTTSLEKNITEQKKLSTIIEESSYCTSSGSSSSSSSCKHSSSASSKTIESSSSSSSSSSLFRNEILQYKPTFSLIQEQNSINIHSPSTSNFHSNYIIQYPNTATNYQHPQQHKFHKLKLPPYQN